MEQKLLEYIGVCYGKLTILEDAGVIKYERYVLCKCECGSTKKVRFKSLKNGDTKSCGCSIAQFVTDAKTVHGLSGHPLHKVWGSMIERCEGENYCSQYKNYGGRGVTICPEWRNDFMSFYNWAISEGWHEGLELDKDIKGNGLLYSPENCFFVTPRQNSWHRSNNRVIEYLGEKKCLAEWCEIFELPYMTTRQRIVRDNWPIDKAFQYKEVQHG